MTSGVDAFLVPYGDRLHLFATPERADRSRRLNIGPAIRVAIAHMPTKDARLLGAYFLQRCPQRQIGDELKISQQAVSMRIERALERLRSLLLVASALRPRCPQCGKPRGFVDRKKLEGRCASCAQRARTYPPSKTAAERMRAYRARQRQRAA